MKNYSGQGWGVGEIPEKEVVKSESLKIFKYIK